MIEAKKKRKVFERNAFRHAPRKSGEEGGCDKSSDSQYIRLCFSSSKSWVFAEYKMATLCYGTCYLDNSALFTYT